MDDSPASDSQTTGDPQLFDQIRDGVQERLEKIGSSSSDLNEEIYKQGMLIWKVLVNSIVLKNELDDLSDDNDDDDDDVDMASITPEYVFSTFTAPQALSS